MFAPNYVKNLAFLSDKVNEHRAIIRWHLLLISWQIRTYRYLNQSVNIFRGRKLKLTHSQRKNNPHLQSTTKQRTYLKIRKICPDTITWTFRERHVSRWNAASHKSLGLEFVGIGAPRGFRTRHLVHIYKKYSALGNDEWSSRASSDFIGLHSFSTHLCRRLKTENFPHNSKSIL